MLSSFFQGWDQGVEAFGKEGMRKLWNASNVRVAGSGLQDSDFLPFLSQVVGDRDVVRRTSSTQQRGGRSVSTSVQRERILDVSDLAAMRRDEHVRGAGRSHLTRALQCQTLCPENDGVSALL